MKTLFAILAVTLLGCAHATKTLAQETTAQPETKKPAAEHYATETITTSKTTKKMFKTEGIKKLQRALAAHAPEVKETGLLDAPTQEALRAFQQSQKLPETGLPDFESLRRNGVRPEEFYEHEPPAAKTGVQ